jgi:hypothetical protein
VYDMPVYYLASLSSIDTPIYGPINTPTKKLK